MVKPPRARDKLDMKLHNRAMVWDLIFGMRPVSRAQLTKITSMSPTSISRIVGELSGFGLLVEAPSTYVGVGRRASMLDINRDALFSVGMDIDVDAIQTCLVDLDNRPRIVLERNLNGHPLPPGDAVGKAREMYLEMLAAAGVARESVKAVGVSVGGTVERGGGVVRVSPQLHWQDVDLGRIVEQGFGVPSVVENDVKAAIFEEYTRYSECRAGNVAYLTIGSGVGAALMYEGKLLRGGCNAAGEIGHVTVQPGGELCDCGRHGCLYTCLSEKSLLEKIGRLSGSSSGFDAWIRSQREGEAWAIGLTNEIAGYIAMALNQILCSYDPQIIIVGGRLVHSHPDLLALALGKKGFIYEALRSEVRILPSLSPNQDAVVGAAIMAKAAFLERMLHEKP